MSLIFIIYFTGLVKSFRKEFGNKLSLILVDDFCAPGFNIDKDIFKDQIQKNLAINVLKKVNKETKIFYSL